MRYATKQSFGGQRASVGRDVLGIYDGEIVSGKIVGIDWEDFPVIKLSHESAFGFSTFEGDRRLSFVEIKSEAELVGVPDRSWCWPPRV